MVLMVKEFKRFHHCHVKLLNKEIKSCYIIVSAFLFYLFIYFFCLFAISWAPPVAYGGSQVRESEHARATATQDP